MKVGMLWFDAEPGQPLEARLARAASYYLQKYGEQPNLCFMHPSAAEGEAQQAVPWLALRTDKAVLPYHFWIGVGRPEAEAA
jgi:hypothetical protein